MICSHAISRTYFPLFVPGGLSFRYIMSKRSEVEKQTIFLIPRSVVFFFFLISLWISKGRFAHVEKNVFLSVCVVDK